MDLITQTPTFSRPHPQKSSWPTHTNLGFSHDHTAHTGLYRFRSGYSRFSHHAKGRGRTPRNQKRARSHDSAILKPSVSLPQPIQRKRRAPWREATWKMAGFLARFKGCLHVNGSLPPVGRLSPRRRTSAREYGASGRRNVLARDVAGRRVIYRVVTLVTLSAMFHPEKA